MNSQCDHQWKQATALPYVVEVTVENGTTDNLFRIIHCWQRKSSLLVNRDKGLKKLYIEKAGSTLTF